MTEMLDVNIEEALARIDEGLVTLAAREILTASEVSDLLLDLRLLLVTAEAEATPIVDPAPLVT